MLASQQALSSQASLDEMFATHGRASSVQCDVHITDICHKCADLLLAAAFL